jgi:transposase
MNSQRYCEQVLESVVKGFFKEMRGERGHIFFQQDNAPCHTSKRTKSWFSKNSIPLLFHPPNSPDLSPIEPVWHELKTLIRHQHHRPTNIHKLQMAVHQAWEKLSVVDIDKYIVTMPERIAAVLASHGGHTRY